jgi:hypothetical protein
MPRKTSAMRKEISYASGKATPPEGVTWPWLEKEITQDAWHIHETLTILKQISAPWTEEADISDIVQCWMMNHQLVDLASRCHPDPDMRALLRRLFEQRKEVMNDILRRAGAKSRLK